MRVLLDTHYLIWMIGDTGMLGKAERDLLTDPENQLLVSPVSIWEIRLKWQTLDRNGERKGALSPADAIAFIEDNEIALTDLSGADCAAELATPLAHRDPFDEQLLIHAQCLDAKLLTRDRLLASHPQAYRF